MGWAESRACWWLKGMPSSWLTLPCTRRTTRAKHLGSDLQETQCICGPWVEIQASAVPSPRVDRNGRAGRCGRAVIFLIDHSSMERKTDMSKGLINLDVTRAGLHCFVALFKPKNLKVYLSHVFFLNATPQESELQTSAGCLRFPSPERSVCIQVSYHGISVLRERRLLKCPASS